ncbi:MAG: 2-dehydro-3-deoxygalactonokinase [Clostridia bacterium]|nr:2-dehydro-3-deoxygalactonokinase [Clostridia bacterium]
MSTYITIDGGTSSTRVNILKNGEILDTVKLNIGARACMGNREKYENEIKSAIDEIVARNNISGIKRILASGMITSEFGLCNLPHINVPAGLSELHQAMYETTINEISDIPFVFMRGVKLDGQDIDNCDMMRGEETELMGIMQEKYGECIYVLPGSHSKIIKTDNHGRIISFSTMLTGEMIASLSQGTILKDAVDLSVSKINAQYLLKGYEYTESAGINKALFKVRILKNKFDCSKEEVYSFFMGIVLCNEILNIIKDETETVVLGGKEQIKKSMALILKEKTNKNVIELDGKTVDYSTSVGMVKIYENRT